MFFGPRDGGIIALTHLGTGGVFLGRASWTEGTAGAVRRGRLRDLAQARLFDSRLNCLLRQKRRNVFGGFAQDDGALFSVEAGGGSSETRGPSLRSG